MSSPEELQPEQEPSAVETPLARLHRLVDEWSFDTNRDQEAELQLPTDLITLLLGYYKQARERLPQLEVELEPELFADVKYDVDNIGAQLHWLLWKFAEDYPIPDIDDLFDNYRSLTQTGKSELALAYFTVLQRLLAIYSLTYLETLPITPRAPESD